MSAERHPSRRLSSLPGPRRLVDWLRAHAVRRFASSDPRWLGLYGETLACSELERRGYAILERSARGRLGELDIVARDGPDLVFVEVKTRKGTGYGRPEEAVGWRKQRKLLALARAYIQRRGLGDVPARFDVVAVEIREGCPPRIEVFAGAFEDG